MNENVLRKHWEKLGSYESKKTRLSSPALQESQLEAYRQMNQVSMTTLGLISRVEVSPEVFERGRLRMLWVGSTWGSVRGRPVDLHRKT